MKICGVLSKVLGAGAKYAAFCQNFVVLSQKHAVFNRSLWCGGKSSGAERKVRDAEIKNDAAKAFLHMHTHEHENIVRVRRVPVDD